MKYIKLFENYPPNSIDENINDMFVELKDQGYKIKYKRFNEVGCGGISVTIEDRRGFNSNDVKEYVMMFIDYIEDKFDEQRVFYRGRTTAYETDDTFYVNGKVVTTDDFPDDTELTALKIGVDARYKDKNQTKLQLENYIDKHYLEQEVTTKVESVRGHKVESALRDILVELFDIGMQVNVTWPSNSIIVLVFHYPLADYGDFAMAERTKKIFKVGDIYEYCLMIDDYIKDFWGEKSECSYEYGSMNRVWSLTELQNNDVRFVRMYINRFPTHKQRALY